MPNFVLFFTNGRSEELPHWITICVLMGNERPNVNLWRMQATCQVSRDETKRTLVFPRLHRAQ